MQTTQKYQVTASEQAVLDGVQVRLINPAEQARFDELIETQHYLRDATLVGERLCYVAEYAGTWLALLAWSAAAYHLKSRDQWIGWKEDHRRRRLNWLVNNSRFLILKEAHYPNLASRVMKLCLQRISPDWQAAYGHPLLAAESFVDSQLFRGTCYKVSGWTQVGLTDGWGRHQQDFYVRHDRPKQVWVRELCANARELLRGEQLPAEWAGLEAQVAPRCSYPVPELQRMVEYFWQMPDWRKVYKRYPCAGLAALTLCATLCGVVLGPWDLAVFAQGTNQYQRRALRFRRNRRTGKYTAPSESTFQRFLAHTDPHTLEKTLQGCQAHVLGPPTEADRLIAFDGKTLRSAGGLELTSGFSVRTGRWLGTEAVAAHSNEIPATQQLLKRTDLTGKTAVLDALHTQVETARQIVQDCGGDYVLTVKGNQKGLGETLTQLWRGAHSAFSPSAVGNGPGATYRNGLGATYGIEQRPHGSADRRAV